MKKKIEEEIKRLDEEKIGINEGIKMMGLIVNSKLTFDDILNNNDNLSTVYACSAGSENLKRFPDRSISLWDFNHIKNIKLRYSNL